MKRRMFGLKLWLAQVAKEGRFVSRSIFEKDHFKFKSVWGARDILIIMGWPDK
jgi:hypothetical protein